MKNFTRRILVLTFLFFICEKSLHSQSVLNPADSVYDYDSLHKPVQPAYGQIGKWVRTPRTYFGWNTNSYKCYIYKGIPFRIKFPKTYNPTANDGKRYPMLIFWHGLGETGETIYDNEFHLWLGCKGFRDAVDNGWFDGYVIAMQTQTALSGFFGSSHYQAMKELIDYMVVNNKLDPFQVVDNGLSSGGIATMNMLIEHPTYVNGAIAMSAPGNFTTPDIVTKIKFTPVWYLHGGLDANPTPGTADYNKYIMDSAGAQFRRTTYPNNYHDTWNSTWIEPDFLPFLNRAYASNPWPAYNKTEYWPGQTVNTTLGLAPGFDAYEWRKDGNLIPGATSNTIQATDFGTYTARVFRSGIWSEWSRIPVTIKAVAGPPTFIEAENYSAMFGIQKEPTQDYGGGQNVGWQDNNDWMDYNVNLPMSAPYQINFRVATQYWGAQFQVRKSDGTILATVTVPQTGNFQFWATTSATVTLPAGQQTLRIITTQANGGWNLNWIEFKPQGPIGPPPPPGNQAPVANAGTPQTITLPTSTVTLTGTGTDSDGTISGYSWTQISGPNTATIASASTASTNVTGLVQGTYVFRLTVTDNQNATGISDVTITVNPAPPPPSSSVKIEAENYSAMLGIQTEPANDVGGGLDVGWQDNNDWMDYNVNLSTAGTYTANFRVASMFTGAQFQLRNSSGTVLASLTVPNTGSFQTWQTITTTVTLPAGAQTLRIITTQANGGWNLNWFELIAGGTPPPNVPPTANAGSNQSITLPTSSVTLNGSGTDSDGTITGYLWTQVSGPNTATIASAATASTGISGLIQGTYVFRLRVTDNQNATATSDVTITVNATPPPNQAPVANAGNPQTITLPASSVTLTGSGTDADGTISSYLWTQVSGPGTATLTNATSAVATASALVQGTYVFRLKVTDNQNATGTADVSITVNAAAPPSNTLKIEAENYSAMFGIQTEAANDVGGGLNVGWQDNGDWMDYNVNLSNAGTYTVNFRVATMFTGPQFQMKKSDGTVLTTVTVPNTGWFQTWTTISSTVTLPAGQQTLRIFTNQANGGWNLNWFELVYVGQAANQPPVANAGNPQTITLPTSTVTLTGSGTDPDGTITGYLWTQVSGPNTATLTNATSAVATASGLVQGSYTFRLRVTDNQNATGTKDVVITVNAAPPTTIHVEAESYSSMFGITVQNTTDTGGGQNVSGQSNNDWMDYTVTLPVAGLYTVKFRVATPNNNVEFRVYNQAGSQLKIMNFNSTGGNQVWTTLSTTIQLPAGQQILRIQTTRASGGWNFNWWEFVPPATAAFAAPVAEFPVEVSQSNGMDVYPTLVRSGFNLKLNNQVKGKVRVRIINSAGAVVKTFDVNKSQSGIITEYLNISELGRGNYIVQAIMDGWVESGKLIKQ